MGALKFSAARSNAELGLLDREVGKAIQAKAKELMDGIHDSQMVVDVFQTGSGTGLNMNANEVIAELASAELGKRVHPNDHVNMSQSSNDVGPSAIRVAAAMAVSRDLLPALRNLSKSLAGLSRRTATVYKSGRTHLRDALPVTMGQEFGAYAEEFARDAKLIEQAMGYMLELPIGGTAVGTGLNADPRFGGLVTKEVAKLSGLGFTSAKNKFRPTRLLTDMSSVSGVDEVGEHRPLQALPGHQADVLRSPHRPWRDRHPDPGGGGWKQHHAGEDEPGDCGKRAACVPPR